MTRDEFKVLVKSLKAVYTQPSFIPDKHAFEVWYGLLGDLDYEICSKAIMKHMQTVEREPTVASIRKQVASLQDTKGELNEMAAWQLVLKAMRNSIYHSEEEFAKLPPIVQKAVVSPGQLREWAMAEDVDGTWMNVTQSNFMRTYRAELAREREMDKLSPEIRRLMCITNEQASVGQAEQKVLTVSEERKISEQNAVPMPERLKAKYAKLMGRAV